MRIPILGCDDVFVLRGRNGVRPLLLETVRNPWPRVCEALALKKPWPRFPDLRHTWKTNARRSGMDPEIRESILGHSSKQRIVSERYGRIRDKGLVSAMDSMTFGHDETEILVAKWKSYSKEWSPLRGFGKMLTVC